MYTVQCTGLWNDKNMYIFHKTKQKMSYISETREPKVYVALLAVKVPFNADWFTTGTNWQQIQCLSWCFVFL